jgi:hypothetical protein
MTHEEIERLKKEILEETDRRYRSIDDCNDRQDKNQAQIHKVEINNTLMGNDLKIIKWVIIILAIIIIGEKGGEFIQGFLL